MPKTTIFSAKVNAGDGFSSPVPLADLPGWTVYKSEQTEIYIITHNLNLSNPERELHVVATSMDPRAHVVIGGLTANSFTVSAWTSDLAAIATDFMFVAVHEVHGRMGRK